SVLLGQKLETVGEEELRVQGGRENSPSRDPGAAGRAALSPAHERCDCPTASPSQESSPSGGQRPLSLPGTQGRGEKNPAMVMSDTGWGRGGEGRGQG
ncbi:hypothetical protein KUCAC02_005767, partial [Chaenocephalus aceratus]